MKGKASVIGGTSLARAMLVDVATGTRASVVEGTGLRKHLRVTPEDAQVVTWVRMEDVVTYTVESNTNWKII